MDSPGEILRLCRLCLVKDQVNIPIFEEQNDSREIFLKISSCLPVKVSREDRLPKKICDGCSEKLNSFYEFWSSSANAEKTLLSWVGEEEVEEKKEPAISKSLAASATLVKEESEPVDEAHAESIEESTKDEAEAPPAKRARRSAAVKAQINLAPDSEDDDTDMAEPLTKMEEESAESDGEEKDPSYTDMPGTSADDEQAGPSGMGKDGVEAPSDSDSVSSIGVSETFNCPSCSVAFSSNIDLLKHNIVCDPQGVYEACPQCEKLMRKEKLVRHQLLHKTVRKKIQFTCQTCTKTFSSRQNLQIHTDKVHNCRNVQYPCDVCGKEFSTKYRAEYHKKTIHLKQFNLHCDQCGRGFVYLTELTAHVSKVHDKNRTTYVCPSDKCGRSFRSKSSLQYHQQISHTVVKPQYICTQCGKVFPHVSLYRRHLTRHNQTKKFSCDLCDNRYSSKHGMEIHRRSHTGERPFVCEHCGNSFTARKFLTVHMVVHTKQRPFECTVCSRSFTQKGSLNIHVKKEHSEKLNIGNNFAYNSMI